MYKRGLVYQAESDVNWDPVDQTVLADEQIDKNGRSWRSGALAQKKSLRQWFFRITSYAQELQCDLDTLPNWPNSVKDMQRNWIGIGDGKMRLRDWLISRQRKWGTPIPIVHCDSCGVVPVPEADLPVIHEKEQVCKCPKCGSASATRETDTMDTFVDSSWYFLRFLDPKNSTAISDASFLKQWMPIDVYIGGIEHAIMHLLYARFIHKVVADLMKNSGYDLPREPFNQLICQGLVEGKTFQCPDSGKYLMPDELDCVDGKDIVKSSGKEALISWDKMSKSKYNGVDPTGLLEKFGSDALRLYVLFKAPPEVPLKWSKKEILGSARFLQKINKLPELIQTSGSGASDEKLIKARNNALITINRAFDLKNHNFNTAVAAVMKLTNSIHELVHDCSLDMLEVVLADLSVMLYPLAPSSATSLLARIRPGISMKNMSWPIIEWKHKS